MAHEFRRVERENLHMRVRKTGECMHNELCQEPLDLTKTRYSIVEYMIVYKCNIRCDGQNCDRLRAYAPVARTTNHVRDSLVLARAGIQTPTRVDTRDVATTHFDTRHIQTRVPSDERKPFSIGHSGPNAHGIRLEQVLAKLDRNLTEVHVTLASVRRTLSIYTLCVDRCDGASSNHGPCEARFVVSVRDGPCSERESSAHGLLRPWVNPTHELTVKATTTETPWIVMRDEAT